MAGVTTPYGFPYLELGDAPNIAQGLQDLANAVNAKCVSIDAAIATINNLAPTSASSTADELSFTSTSFVPGATVVGCSFVAPPSGIVFVTLSAILSQNINTQATFASVEVKTGATIGSGTLVGSAANSDRGLTVGRAVNAGAIALLQASRRVLWSGLTPGATYNARCMHCVDGGGGSMLYRELLVEPAL